MSFAAVPVIVAVITLTMNIYQGTNLIAEKASHDDFVAAFANAVTSQSDTPFLLVRSDDSRMLVAAHDGSLLLAVARDSRDFGVSYGSTYAEGDIVFQGLRSECIAAAENFIDAGIGMNGVRAFFLRKRLHVEIDIKRSLPDEAILEFPTPIGIPVKTERKTISKRVNVTELLRTDMNEVCEFVTEVEDDPDENIDFGDAIQIGSLCGGRINRKTNQFHFSYHDPNGEVWSFDLNRTIMDSVADGSTKQLSVSATVPSGARYKCDARSPACAWF